MHFYRFHNFHDFNNDDVVSDIDRCDTYINIWFYTNPTVRIAIVFVFVSEQFLHRYRRVKFAIFIINWLDLYRCRRCTMRFIDWCCCCICCSTIDNESFKVNDDEHAIYRCKRSIVTVFTLQYRSITPAERLQ